jgi:AAA domain
MAKKSNNTSTVTFYPSFQALAAAAKAENANGNGRHNGTDDDQENACEHTLDLRSAADYQAQPVDWLWPEKIPLGKVTLLVGDPGLGKSLVAVDVASRVSRGLPFPANAKSAEQSAKSESCSDSTLSALGSLLILSADDTIADTIRPRLDAHGADPAKIFFAPALTDLRRELPKLEALLERIPDCRLIVVDPVSAYVGPSDSHFHTIVRKVLGPLAELANKRRLAVLAVTHLRKHTGAAITRAVGSMGFAAAARTVWTVCRDPENVGRHFLLPVKNNLGKLGDGLAYSIETHAANGAARIRWHDAAVSTGADEVLTPRPKSRGPEAEDRRNAGQWLRAALADGPRESYIVLREGKQNGFGERTLQRALHMIGGQTRKRGYLNGWFWSLPAFDEATPHSASNRNSAPAVAAGIKKPPITEPTLATEKPVAFEETCRLRESRHGITEQGRQTDAPAAPAIGSPVSRSLSRRLPDSLSASPTGNALLDRILAGFHQPKATERQLLSTPLNMKPPHPPPQPSNLDQQRTTDHGPRTTDHAQPIRRKKSARSHSRFLREQTPGTSLAQRTTHDPERCIVTAFPPT